MNVHEAAKRLGKGESTLRRWIREGKLEATIINGVYDIPETAIIDQPLTSQKITDNQSYISIMLSKVQSLERENNRLIEQLTEKDKQISELHQLLMVTENKNQLMLEYHQTPFWRRWFKKKEQPNI